MNAVIGDLHSGSLRTECKLAEGFSILFTAQESDSVLIAHGNPDSWKAKGAYAHKTNNASSTDDIDWAAAQDPANNMYAYNAATVVFVPFSVRRVIFSI